MKDDGLCFNGENEWSRKGGVVRWTHHAPAGRHPPGGCCKTVCDTNNFDLFTDFEAGIRQIPVHAAKLKTGNSLAGKRVERPQKR